MLAFGLTIFTIIILSLFGRVEYLIDQLPHTKAINLTFHNTDINNIYILEETLKNKKIKSKRLTMNKSKGQLFLILRVKGSQKQFVELNEELIKMESIMDYY